MKVARVTNEQVDAFAKSMKGVRRTKTKINNQLRHGGLTQAERESRMYKIELLNAIEGFYRVVLSKSNKNYTHSKKRWSKKKLSQ